MLKPDFIGDGWIAQLLRDGVILMSDAEEVSDRFGEVNLDGVGFPADDDLRLCIFVIKKLKKLCLILVLLHIRRYLLC